MNSDQEFFRSTTAKFLEDQAPVATLRQLRTDSAGFDATYWRRGAELGWTSLLVEEEHGGGSLSGDGLMDLRIVAYEFGRRAAPGPLLPTNVVAAALDAAASHADVVTALMAGTAVAAWCFAEPPQDGLDGVGLDIRDDGDGILVSGRKRPVEAAGSADYLLVTGHTDDGVTQVLVPASAAGVSIRPLRSVDQTRRFAVVSFDDVRLTRDAVVGKIGAADEQVRRQLRQALVLQNAESVGALQTAFDMTLQWSFDRYSFGRALASYQAIKHRFADMKSWLEAAHAIADESGQAVTRDDPRADELLSAAKSFIGDYGSELMQDCVQLHGGIGMTYEHDLHLYLRRHTVNRATFGTPEQHRRRIADLLEAREGVA